MADIDQKFQEAADAIKNLKTRPTDLELLEIYGLFKQASEGDCNAPKPGMFQLKEKAKHEYWMKRKGLSQSEAKEEYVKEANKLLAKYKS